jgi:hypothetical protein
MEPRELLTGVLPVLTVREYDAVVVEVRDVVGALARSHNFNRAEAALARVAAQIPFGTQRLLPVWLSDLGIYSARIHGSGLVMEGQILKDLKQDVVTGVTDGLFTVTGPGSSAFLRSGLGAPAVSVASVTVKNSTGLNITATAFLNGTTQQITRAIGVNGSALFDFGSSSNNFITLNIQRSDGLRPPPPSIGNILNRPIGGYNGKLFTITVFANLFSVSV